MARALAMIGCFVLFVGCNANESKEGRIRYLEKQSEQTATKMDELEERILNLESNRD
jgi:molybdopterin synthase catalytic subunit